jgi:hypothetical protein
MGVALRYTLTGIKYESTFAAVTRCISEFEGHPEVAKNISNLIAYTARKTNSEDAVADMSNCIAKYRKHPEAAAKIANIIYGMNFYETDVKECVTRVRSAANLAAGYRNSPEAAMLILNNIVFEGARAFKTKVDIFSDKEIFGFILSFDEKPKAAGVLTKNILEIVDEGGNKEYLLEAISKANASGKYRLIAGVYELNRLQYRLKGTG